MRKTMTWALALGAMTCALGATATAKEHEHFHPKGKQPSEFTIKKQQEQREFLPFEDERDFEEQKRGFIAAPDYTQIMADAGHVAWDMGRYAFLLEDEEYDSIHPSLMRQAILNANFGLYEVMPGIYQVRGFDLANITFIKGETGWIVFDPLTAKETARAALELVTKHLGKRPVVAVVYSHSHGDHFLGVRGVIDEADVRAGKCEIIAPVGFMDHAIAENVAAGNAMTRRLTYQYGTLLPASPFGHVDQSIGKNVAAGTPGLIAPTRVIEGDTETVTIDGVEMVFQNTPGTEAPAEMNTYFPQYKAFWAAENITATVHNIYTLRGALVRDSHMWSKHINAALYMFGQDADVMFASHSWPRWGNDRIQEVMRAQRDIYGHLNNQVLHLANSGVTVNQVHNVYKPPMSLQKQWTARGYHGSFEHNSRAVINRYLGYWDCNPATLTPLSPEDSAPLYVEMMGGAAKIIAKGQELHDTGKYRHAQEILMKLVYAEPENQAAKDVLADCWEQLGYQYESPSLRNSFLMGAKELRDGIVPGASAKASGPDVIKAMTTELFLDYLGIRVDDEKAVGMAFTINLITPDNDEKFIIEMSNSTLTNLEGYLAETPDLTITIDRKQLELVMMGEVTLAAQVEAGKCTLTGDASVLQKLASTLAHFDPFFEILPGTKAGEKPDMNPFEQEPPAMTGE